MSSGPEPHQPLKARYSPELSLGPPSKVGTVGQWGCGTENSHGWCGGVPREMCLLLAIGSAMVWVSDGLGNLSQRAGEARAALLRAHLGRVDQTLAVRSAGVPG